MKYFFVLIVLIFVLASCHKTPTTLVDKVYIDSLLTHYIPSTLERVTNLDGIFWKRRMDSLPGSYMDTQKYAGALSSKFHLYGDINDLMEADSLMRWLNKEYQGKEAGVYRTLAGYATQRHRFWEANDDIRKAVEIGSDKYASELINMDVAFELGRYGFVKEELRRLHSTNNYGYFFRLSKYQHWQGSLDSSIISMKKAVELAANNDFLKQVALSNVADLYLHAGELEQAAATYQQSIALDAADFHSLAGLGWIALVHDKKDILAERIFHFIESKTKSPDILFKLSQVAEQRGDSLTEKKYAQAFAERASKEIYGNMYNKYLIDLYGGILHEPAKMLAIAEKEIANRATPQTYCWYVWALFKNNQSAKAFQIYDKYVSEQPLEGLELYYMGQMMRASKKEYNAKNFLKAAYKNRYDLSPVRIEELEKEFN